MMGLAPTLKLSCELYSHPGDMVGQLEKQAQWLMTTDVALWNLGYHKELGFRRLRRTAAVGNMH